MRSHSGPDFGYCLGPGQDVAVGKRTTQNSNLCVAKEVGSDREKLVGRVVIVLRVTLVARPNVGLDTRSTSVTR